MSCFAKHYGEICYKRRFSSKIEKSHSEKLLGVIIDNKLSFEGHIETLCSKARSKLGALFSVPPTMNVNPIQDGGAKRLPPTSFCPASPPPITEQSRKSPS